MNILIYGSREFGQVVRELLRVTDHHFCGFIDDMHSGEEVLGTWDQCHNRFSPADTGVVVAVGYRNLQARWTVFERVRDAGFDSPSLIHPLSIIASTAVIGDGCLIMAGAIVDTRAQLDQLVVAWPGAIVNHDSIVECNTFLSPGATVCGSSRVKSNTFLGAGAIVTDHVTVPENSFVKAGSVFSGKSTSEQRS
ncbi:MAG: hypothetical protein VX527_03110 [Planctomycetota bacterium]|nr:hypothetical protein [Planctomycetota bacterium]